MCYCMADLYHFQQKLKKSPVRHFLMLITYVLGWLWLKTEIICYFQAVSRAMSTRAKPRATFWKRRNSAKNWDKTRNMWWSTWRRNDSSRPIYNPGISYGKNPHNTRVKVAAVCGLKKKYSNHKSAPLKLMFSRGVVWVVLSPPF